jgi:transposase-like protein
MLTYLAEAYESLSLPPPRTILTDKERALMTVIETVFPDTKNMICIWHININILKKARPLLADQVTQARRDRREALREDPRTRLTPAEA